MQGRMRGKLKNREFVCPECNGDLVKQENSYICRDCLSNWEIRNEVPCFLKENIRYWCELSADEADNLNRLAESVGWRKAAESSFTEKLQRFVLDERRINWKYLIESNVGGRILDAGSGWGTLSFSLAKDCELVYAFESVWERVEFIQIRKRQDKIVNLKPVCGNISKLPFPDDYFDVVILNGVLEWLGLSDLSCKPSEAQERALRSIFRVLKPGGSLYIGIENRFAYFYFVGVKDPHSGLRFATLMPRVFADLYSRIVKKKGYRTYIYSRRGYKNLLVKAGFRKVYFYVPVPGYLNFKYIVPLDSPGAFKYCLLNILYYKTLFSPSLLRFFFVFLKIFFRTPLKRFSKYFVPDYSIIAVK